MTPASREEDQTAPEVWTSALGLPLLGNRFVVAVAQAQILTRDDAEAAVEHWSDSHVRRSLDERLVAAAVRANDAHFRFDIRELHDPGGPRVERWPADRSDWSLDEATSTRKLTLVLMLANTGSAAPAVHFPARTRTELIEPGHVLMFPSFLECKPIPEAEAVALVTYAHGPAFR